MADVRKHVPLTISRPSVEELLELGFQKVGDETGTDAWKYKIPYRYPFANISNLANLQTEEFFRHATLDVSDEIGGSSVADAKTNLGFQLPRTEKLVLLVKGVGAIATNDVVMTITGSTKYNKPDVTYTFAVGDVTGKVYEIDLYEFGLLIEDGEVNIEFTSATAANLDKLEVALVARMG